MTECHKEDKTPPQPFRSNFIGFGQILVGHLKCARLDGNQDNSMRLKCMIKPNLSLSATNYGRVVYQGR